MRVAKCGAISLNKRSSASVVLTVLRAWRRAWTIWARSSLVAPSPLATSSWTEMPRVIVESAKLRSSLALASVV